MATLRRLLNGREPWIRSGSPCTSMRQAIECGPPPTPGLRRFVRSPPWQLLRLDLCASAALGLSMTDPLSSAEFSSRFALMALQTGEPYRAALALAGEATQLCHGGGARRYAQARALLERASTIAARL